MSNFSSQAYPPKTSPFFFVAHQSALDFANTLAASKESPLELISDFTELCRWLVAADLVTTRQADAMLDWPHADRASFLAEAKAYRTQLKNLVAALGQKQPVPDSYLVATNRLLREAGAVMQVRARSENSFQRTWPVDYNVPRSVLGLVAELGLQLVCECDLNLVRQCENPLCVLAFYDTTKNHQRRWCRMEGCGNRHKAALHRQKKRGKALLPFLPPAPSS